MSGIAGIIHFDGQPVAPGLVESMTQSMHYRGPDGINHWRRGSVALGQCMLRTTPESLEETQPLTNEDESLVLVMDGRVDNWEELRRELLGKGAVLRTRADAELVLRAYEVWGRDCLAAHRRRLRPGDLGRAAAGSLLRAGPHGQQAIRLPLDLAKRFTSHRNSKRSCVSRRLPRS